MAESLDPRNAGRPGTDAETAPCADASMPGGGRATPPRSSARDRVVAAIQIRFKRRAVLVERPVLVFGRLGGPRMADPFGDRGVRARVAQPARLPLAAAGRI